MKTNILIIGFDLPFLNEFSIRLADVFKYKHIDIGKHLDTKLLENINTPLIIDNAYSEVREKRLYNLIAEKENVVATLLINDFIANDNYKIFEDSYIILVAEEDENVKNIINFTKKHVDLVLKQENLKIDEVIKEIKG